ncbi:MAG: efflux RND transporter permease subunit, partial [Planctomycetota bacterium]
GLSLGGHITEATEGDFFVRLGPRPRRPLDEVMDEVRERVERLVPGLEIELAKLMEDLIGDLTAVPQPIEVRVFSDDVALLRRLAPRVVERIAAVPGVVDAKDGIVLAGDALDIEVSRTAAALEGLSPEAVSRTLHALLTGEVTTEVQAGPKMIGLRTWLPEARRGDVAALAELRLSAPDGHTFPLKRVATIARVTGQPQINRADLKGMVAVTARISGRDMGSTVDDVIRALDRPGTLPEGVYYSLGGLYEQQRIAFRGLIAVFVGAVALVFVLILFLYESFRVAAAMLVTALLASAAVFIGLLQTGSELNITAIMGMTMVVGIVTEVSIFYWSEYRDLGHEGTPEERLVRAGQNRLRPILMTTIAAFLALLPLALGLGEGAAMLQPLAIAVLSGLAVQVVLVLFAFPLLLTMLRAL